MALWHLRVSKVPSAVTKQISSPIGNWLSRLGRTGASPMWLPVISPLGGFAIQIAFRAMDVLDLQRFHVDPEVNLAPDPPLRATMLAGVSLAFALNLDARAVHCPAVYHAVMSRKGTSRCSRPFDPRQRMLTARVF